MTAERQLGLLWGAVAVLVVGLAPFASELAAVVPACPVKSLTGLPCPSCGTTRAALALTRFELLESLAMNPVAGAAWLGLVGGGIVAGALALAGAPLREPGWIVSPWARWSLISILLANWAYLIGAGV